MNSLKASYAYDVNSFSNKTSTFKFQFPQSFRSVIMAPLLVSTLILSTAGFSSVNMSSAAISVGYLLHASCQSKLRGFR